MHSRDHKTRQAIRLVALLGIIASGAFARPLKLYVSPSGNDAWSGRARTRFLHPLGNNGPFATIQRARDEIRALRKAGQTLPEGAVIELQAGTYTFASPFELTAEDSGIDGGPIVYCARKGKNVRIVGGAIIPSLTGVSDEATLAALTEEAKAHVLEADLSALGITDYGSPNPTAHGCEVFYGATPMILARWPNQGFTHVKGVTEEQGKTSHGKKGSKVGKLFYDNKRVERWTHEPAPWVNGFWFWDWAEQAHPISKIDPEKGLIELEKPYHHYGYRKGQWFYGFNLLCELDTPGEYYIDRTSGKLYLWPPEGVSKKDTPRISVLPHAITTQDASYITFRGLTIEALRNTAIIVKGGTGNRIEACTIRNTGNRAVEVSGGTGHTVFGCDIYDTANGSVTLSGGDRKTLTPARHLLENCWIRRYGRLKRTFCTSVSLQGVGQTARRNLIHDAPYIAIWFGGNDHVIELNEIHSVCREANDSGAIYAGRDWSMRGTTIRHNFIHDVVGFEGRGCNGIYLDDMFSGTEVTGNIVTRVPRAFLIGGGRDNILTNNVIVDCKYGMHIDARALGWAKKSVPTTMTTRLKAMPYESDLWKKRFPKLPSTLTDEPGCPKGNIVARNIAVNTTFDRMCPQAEKYGEIGENLIDEDPLFVAPERDDYRLKPQSPALAIGFIPIPIERIGVYRHPQRLTWPVRHSVRLPAGVTDPHKPVPLRPRAAGKGPKPIFKVARRAANIIIDGQIQPDEWFGCDLKKALIMNQKLDRTPSGMPSTAWLCHDDEALYIAMENQVDAARPLTTQAVWGGNDAVEVAVRNPTQGKQAPILVLRGYPCGQFQSSNEAGAPKAAVATARQGVQFAAKAIEAGRWLAEWRIPFASLGVNPKTTTKLDFNLTTRKTGSRLWVLWVGTLDLATWDVRNGGILDLAD